MFERRPLGDGMGQAWGMGGGAVTVQSLTAAGDGGRQARPSARWGRVFVFTAAPNFVPKLSGVLWLA